MSMRPIDRVNNPIHAPSARAVTQPPARAGTVCHDHAAPGPVLAGVTPAALSWPRSWCQEPILAMIMLLQPHDRGQFRPFSMIVAGMEQILPLPGRDHGLRPFLATITGLARHRDGSRTGRAGAGEVPGASKEHRARSRTAGSGMGPLPDGRSGMGPAKQIPDQLGDSLFRPSGRAITRRALQPGREAQGGHRVEGRPPGIRVVPPE